MIDYGRYKLSFSEAKKEIDVYDNMDDDEFRSYVENWAKFSVSEDNYAVCYSSIRDEMVDLFKKTLKNSDNKINYDLDLKVGIKLYELMNPQNGFDIISANDDDIWRYISIRVMPDLTFIRYPNQIADIELLEKNLPGLNYAIGVKSEKDSMRMKKKRFYSHTRRIWLKTLWWYVHLGWQGTAEKTYDVLKNNGTNIISHFIERPGRGYRTSLFRTMLYAYSLLPEQKDSIFRAAAKLNLAKCMSIEPALADGGEEAYAEKLFQEVYLIGEREENVETSNS